MKSIKEIREKVSNQVFAERKKLYQKTLKRPENPTIAFVIGCQRSGTSLMLDIFNNDMDVKVYPERSILSSQDEDRKIRLNPLPTVKVELDKDTTPLIVMKPLVETQRSPELLDYFAGSKALWMYRHYKDVARSNLKRFGQDRGVRNLRPIVEREPNNWRSEYVPEPIRDIVVEHFHEDMPLIDAAALFWYVRNSYYFEFGYDQNPDVMIFRYNHFVTQPAKMVPNIYKFLGQKYPGDKVVSIVHPSSVGKGQAVEISPAIESLCIEMLERLDNVYKTRDYYLG